MKILVLFLLVGYSTCFYLSVEPEPKTAQPARTFVVDLDLPPMQRFGLKETIDQHYLVFFKIKTFTLKTIKLLKIKPSISDGTKCFVIMIRKKLNRLLIH